uniref:Uncharacterized protein n=1 Tax=Vespula pensylvanica TaxID=30213 RepID=A0A834KSA5_VESPE|nr:hypothetical protein H0235_013005 [Vespula pensylvanica]
MPPLKREEMLSYQIALAFERACTSVPYCFRKQPALRMIYQIVAGISKRRRLEDEEGEKNEDEDEDEEEEEEEEAEVEEEETSMELTRAGRNPCRVLTTTRDANERCFGAWLKSQSAL